jgi:hypothetical protein
VKRSPSVVETATPYLLFIVPTKAYFPSPSEYKAWVWTIPTSNEELKS